MNSAAPQPPALQIETLLFLYQSCNWVAAERCAVQMTHQFPHFAFGWKALGAIAKQTGHMAQSVSAMRQAVKLAPLDAEAHSNLGVSLQEVGQFAEAVSCFREAIRLQPDFFEAHNNLGNALQTLGQFEEAVASYRQSLHLRPEFAQAHNNLGNALRELGLAAEALHSYREALRIDPELAETHNNLGNVLRELGHLHEAEQCFLQALRHCPDLAEAHNNLGNLLQDLGRFSAALQCFREALRIKPHFFEAHSNLLFCLNYLDGAFDDSAIEQAREFGRVVSKYASPKFETWTMPKKAGPLRIGFVSGDFRQHPVGYFLAGLLSHLDRSQFEVVAIPTSMRADGWTDRIKRLVGAWVPIVGLDDRDAASLIHQRGIDLLVDLSGHTAHNRLPVFAYQPAPVQTSWLGYFATTGLPEMTFFLGDPVLSPPSESKHFVEKLWNLPSVWFSSEQPDSCIPVSNPPALQNGHVTFGCFGNLSKMNRIVSEQWAAILKQVPDAKLFLKSGQLADVSVKEETTQRFACLGISNDRLILEGPSPREQYFNDYGRVDVVLDTFPYPGGTTSMDALWMGVPVLTMKGDRFLSRLGESIALHAGQHDWIANSVEDYVQKAVTFASDLPKLQAWRFALRGRLTTTPLFDTPTFARQFGDSLWQMFREYNPDSK